ncbi:MAG: TolC family protein [Candidatus Omnitrophica bacterium]|nr:TolC family protein [Candidatus Omnitrophota bacterium]
MRVLRWSLLPCLLWSGIATAAQPLTLEECYQLALSRSEELAIQAEVIKATEGRFLQALAQALPTVSFVSTDKRQDGSGSSAFTLKNVPERKFTFSQPLFSGFKEFAAIAGSRDERRQRVAERERAELLLLVDVVEAFYLLREQQEDFKALEAIRVTLEERLNELRQRETLGRTRHSEVASAKAQLRRVEAERELVLGRIETARHLLEFLTGLPEVDVVTDAAEPLPKLEPVSAYLSQATERPDVRAAESAWKVAQHTVTIAKSELWPSVDLDGNYYTKRVGNASGVDWDVTLTVDVPIFQGGEAVGKVREESSQARQAHLRFEATMRQALREIDDLYSQTASSQERYLSLKRAHEASEESFRLQVEDYRVNLVNHLDVLQELQALQDARRDLINATYEMKRLYWRLQTAVGQGMA